MEAANGFLNRFCFIACRRQRLLPDGGHPDPLDSTGMAERLGAHLTAARRVGHISLDLAAVAEWRDIYTRLLYTLIDGRRTIRSAHLRAGVALWDYAARSIVWATPPATGDPLAEQIHATLAASTDGLTQTQLRDLFNRNQPIARVDTALTVLAQAGRAQRRRHPTAGRPAEIWTAVPTTP